jgi:hypothetical protein
MSARRTDFAMNKPRRDRAASAEHEAHPAPAWLVARRELHTSRRIRALHEILADGLAQLTQEA